MKRVILFIVILFIETVIILYYGVFLYKRQNVLGTYSVSLINKEYLLFPEDSSLKYYYESTSSASITVSNDWLEEKVTYTLNEDGLNERYDYLYSKPPHTFRIMTLGDSFTFGDNVNTKDNWPEQLEDILNITGPCGPQYKFEVINLGMSGYDMQYALERFNRKGIKYKPDLIIWFLNGDRWNELMHEKLIEKENQLTEEERNDARLKGDYYPEWTFASIYVSELYSERQKLEQYRLFMQKFSSIYKNNLLFMTLSDIDERFKSRLKYLVIERGGDKTWYYDGLPQLYMGVTMLPDNHPNKTWYRETAELLSNYVIDQKMITCNTN